MEVNSILVIRAKRMMDRPPNSVMDMAAHALMGQGTPSMATEIPDQGYWTVVAAICGAAIGAGGTALNNIFRSRSSMAALVDARIRMLIDGYEKRIADLQDEIRRLEGKVDALTNVLEEERLRNGLVP
ncbi:MAG TPA: hypothetical protein VL996_08015 [Methylocella sp.]|nr:hypothetical protein [Methylocella sp.]